MGGAACGGIIPGHIIGGGGGNPSENDVIIPCNKCAKNYLKYYTLKSNVIIYLHRIAKATINQ